ncbi:SDR family oxidoreductase [Brevibacillus nitrificans]|uniref:SDR family oxidoreductase n=1 Tax=Brevibacillus nitrificans TaxID=651560 RepID=A0A3M8D4Q0_9BACL|nr:SDR family oxidoreductase [Brevibacillus nitrificans]RNB82561.1 SDR family oxidoreductase [Brevibacillus nitrificans]
MDLGLKGKVVLVTAASKGLGYAVAETMLAEGARVAISSRNEESTRKAAEQLSQGGKYDVFHVQADLSNPAETGRLMDQVLDHFGRVDILVCNTGGPKTADFVNTTFRDWQNGMDMMLYPVLQMTERVIPKMKENKWGRIIYMTSTWVKQPRQSGVISTMARSAISGLSKHLSNELAPDNILVNQVMPGPTWTDRSKEITSRLAEQRGVPVEVIKAEIAKEIPLGRYGTAEEIAQAVTFLASEKASFITGASLQVDGGQIKATV